MPPSQLEAGFSLQEAIALHNGGELAKAKELYTKLLHADPRNSDCLHLLGVIAAQKNDRQLAIDLIGEAIKLMPGNAVYFSNRGIVYCGLREFDRALDDFAKAIEIDAECVDAYVYRGAALSAINKNYLALESYDIALILNPNSAVAHSNRANTLRGLGLHREAIVGYDKAIGLDPRFAEAYSNRGIALKELGLLDDALTSYDKAISINPESAEARSNRATVLLLKGEMSTGWEWYEWHRDKVLNAENRREFGSPLWRGDQILEGKVVLLHSEQGYGDIIQFCRYARMLAQRGCGVIMEVPSALRKIFLHLEGVNQLIVRGEEIPAHDFHCPLMSLPRAFGTTLLSIPAQPQYLFPAEVDIREWSGILGPKRVPRIGLAWSGNPAHPNDKNRSIRIGRLLRHLPGGFEYHCLQTDGESLGRALSIGAAATVKRHKCLSDFSQTAALSYLMDLVISVDTSVAHLSGALGRPTWLLLPFLPDWRWMMDRDDSPWYPSMKLFRQKSAGDWETVLIRIRQALGAI